MDDRAIARGMRLNLHPLDEDSATRLLQGAVHPDDAPPGYASVADLLATAASLPAVDEGAGAATISAMVEAIRVSGPIPETSQRRSMIGKLFAGKAVVAVALALTAGGAAAASGTLPDQAQAVVSDAVSHVGVNIPHPNHGKSKDHRQDGVDKPSGEDEAPAGDDNSAEDKGMSGVVEELKTHRATDAGPLGQDVCKVASENKCHSGTENKGKGGDDAEDPESDGPKENQGRSDEHGKPEVTPTTPTTGSIATGEDHSGRDLPSSGKGKAGSDDD